MIQHLERLFLRLENPPFNFQHDSRNYAILIDSLCKSKLTDKVIEYLNRMQQNGINRSYLIYLSIVTALAYEGNIDEMIQYFNLCQSESF